MKKIKFKSFSSGSCGNCYFLGIEEDGRIVSGIVVDAGVSTRRLKKYLMEEGLDFDSFSAILVTHDHFDHIRSLGSFCKHLKKPVYSTEALVEAMSGRTYTLDCFPAVKKTLAGDGWNEVADRISVKYFEVPHDATQTVGYFIDMDGYKVMIMTDSGEMTQQALQYARESDSVVIESNYDVDMLMGGPYTYELKMRICNGHGHLSNDKCASAIKKFIHPGLRHIFLCHLSENNNTPKLAYDCSAAALKETGAEDVRLHALPRQNPSPMFEL